MKSLAVDVAVAVLATAGAGSACDYPRLMPTLAVIGAGPKGIAIAAKARALAAVGLDAPEVVLVDRSAVAGNWSGRQGTRTASCRWERRRRRTSGSRIPTAGAPRRPRSPRRWRSSAGSGI